MASETSACGEKFSFDVFFFFFYFWMKIENYFIYTCKTERGVVYKPQTGVLPISYWRTHEICNVSSCEICIMQRKVLGIWENWRNTRLYVYLHTDILWLFIFKCCFVFYKTAMKSYPTQNTILFRHCSRCMSFIANYLRSIEKDSLWSCVPLFVNNSLIRNNSKQNNSAST